MQYLEETAGVLVKKIKPDFKKLGPKYGKQMKTVAEAVNQMSQEQITQLEQNGSIALDLSDSSIILDIADVEISSEDIPGWLVATEGKYTVALDIQLNNELLNEGIARELVNRIQNFRKEAGFEVTDKIDVMVSHSSIDDAINDNKDYICSETLAVKLELVSEIAPGAFEVEIDEDLIIFISLEKHKTQ